LNGKGAKELWAGIRLDFFQPDGDANAAVERAALLLWVARRAR